MIGKKNSGNKKRTKFIISILLLSLTIILFAGAASAETIYVNATGGNDTNNGLTPATAKLTIGNATGTVNAGGTVSIADGTYKGPKNRGITINKNMIITGESQNGTIIDAEQQAGIFTIKSGVTVTLENLTIRNGTVTNKNSGGAINNDGTLTVVNCTFTNNTSNWDYGGAIATFIHGTLTVTECIFTGNNAEIGGAIYNYGGTLTVTKSAFTGNTAIERDYGGVGGTIYNYIGTLTVTESAFAGNSATDGGGAIYNEGSGSGVTTLNFNRFYDNTAYFGDAIYNLSGSVNAENNWWGYNTNPKNISNLIYIVNSEVDADPWMMLNVSVKSSSIPYLSNSNIMADLSWNTINGTDPNEQPSGGHIPNGTPVEFGVQTGPGNVNPTNSTTTKGTAESTYTGTHTGTTTIYIQVDNEKLTLNISIYKSNTTLTVDAASGVYKGATAFYATLKDQYNNSIKGADVEFYVNGSLIGTGTTNSNGIASILYTPIMLDPAGSPYPITAIFDGDENYNGTSGMNNLTVSISITYAQLLKATGNIKKYYERHSNRLPSSLKVVGQTLNMPQLLKIFVVATINFSKKNKNPISITTVGKAPYPRGIYASGEIYNYISIAKNINTFINNKGRAPNYAQTTRGNIPFSKLVYMYAKVINFYGQHKRLPWYVATYKI